MLNRVSNDLNLTLDEQIPTTERHNTIVVCAIWVSKENPLTHEMFCEHLNHLQCVFIQGLKCTTEQFIGYLFLHSLLNCLAEKTDRCFNMQSELHLDIKKKFIIVISHG